MKAQKIYEVDLDKWIHAEFLSFVEHKVQMEKGEYILVNVKGGKRCAIISCPKCGSKNPIVTHDLIFHREKQPIILSIKPSINNRQCCGYHGYLTNGRFTNV